MPLASPPASVFPLYLLPSIPFRRRSSAVAAESSPSSPSPSLDTTSSNGPSPTRYLTNSQALLRCCRCLAHIAPAHSIISKGFTGRHGRAYLVAPPGSASGFATPPINLPRHHNPGNLPNTHTHKPVPRQLVTGAHTVSDISCAVCGSVLGWQYVSAAEDSQRYKVGRFILETKRVMQFMDWESGNDTGVMQDMATKSGGPSGSEKRKDSGVDMGFDTAQQDPVEFDSQDEDECEDLFMGIWSPSLAKKRRRNKLWGDERD
ncbi:Protein yippee-like protein [Venturia nashicola]|uniref:Protein yippee-like protein n=1 Tax=Venturia nashicola TaxID=86259 RepID=A0A4Z1PBL5_9PEZI|nr:Protein yippee-like protein [Venturia nashicola]